ncbi:O-antigen ligase [Microbacterium sp. SORGH_AS428]|uniref:O-antigen ligase family protein n=1 Tax=Microbacterium sp. SORGH_AS_0428 TaxID=3041788 RepID=UPI00285E6980|nr:O-antigen ligase family protein [Microbacterium sp. SORGH_AS_0428]MDR6199297.1 O-antigen ligase [Microbacterium sp. SORGH_AS_0428]
MNEFAIAVVSIVVAVVAFPLIARFAGAKLLLALFLLRVVVDGAYTFSLGSLPITSVLGILLLVVGVALTLQGRRGVGMLAFALTFLAISTAFGAATLGGDVVWPYFLRIAAIISASFGFLNVSPRPRLTTIAGVVELAAVASALVTYVQVATGTSLLVDGLARPAGLMAHPNSAALLYGAGILAAIFGLSHGRRKLIHGIAGLVIAGAVIVTGSLGGIASITVMLLAYVFVSGTLPSRLRIATAGVTVALVLVFVFSPLGSERLAELSNLDLSGQRASTNSLEWRVSKWRILLQIWEGNRVFGVGYGVATSGSLIEGGFAPHNEYVRALVDTGIVGLVVALVFAVAGTIKLVRIASRSDQPQVNDMAAVSAALLIGMLINSASDNTFTYAVPTLVLGMTAATVFNIRHGTHPRVGVRLDSVQAPKGRNIII